MNDDDYQKKYYYAGIPYQTRTYEVTGLSWSSGQGRILPEAFSSILDVSPAPGNYLLYENDGTVSTAIEKRIVEWTRSYFRTNASAAKLDIELDQHQNPSRTLANRLPLGKIESLALPYESFKAAFTPRQYRRTMVRLSKSYRPGRCIIITGY